MIQERYDEICRIEGATPLGHPELKEMGEEPLKDVTVVIPQRKTKEFTQITLESLLRFYPTIKVILIDGDSQDASSQYCRFSGLKYPNVHSVNYIGRNSHGEILNYAFNELVKTKYVVTMDSDTITCREGWIEGMLKQFENPKLYATGTLMLVTYKGECCNTPIDDDDICRYAHPSCSMYDLDKYFEIGQPCTDHGSCFALNMMKVRDDGKYKIGAFPTDQYVRHRMGSSWVVEHQIVWPSDHDTFIRPFVTFLIDTPNQINQFQLQTDKDFSIVALGDNVARRIWETTTRDINNKYFDIRFQANGEFVIHLTGEDVINPDFVKDFKNYIIECRCPEYGEAMGVTFWERKYFQNQIALF